jgi:hypothetical protein
MSTGRIILTNAQLLALNTSPVTLIPAPGAGMMTTVRGYVLSLTFVTTALSGGGVPNIFYGSSSGQVAVAGSTISTTLGNTASVIGSSNPPGSAGAPSLFTNLPIVLAQPDGDYTTGDSTATITLLYSMVTL